MPKNKNQRRKNKRNLSKKNNGKINSGDIQQMTSVGLTWRMPSSTMFPDNLVTTLHYVSPMTAVAPGAVTNFTKYYRSDAYDVDPALGSTAMAGFTELAAIYGNFRTLKMRYQFRIQSFEATQSVSVTHGWLPNLTTMPGSLTPNYGENPYFRTDMLGPPSGGQGLKTFVGQMDLSRLIGSKMEIFDDTFVGSTSSSTLSRVVVCCFGLNTPAIFATGIDYQAKISLELHFFRRNAVIS